MFFFAKSVLLFQGNNNIEGRDNDILQVASVLHGLKGGSSGSRFKTVFDGYRKTRVSSAEFDIALCSLAVRTCRRFGQH